MRLTDEPEGKLMSELLLVVLADLGDSAAGLSKPVAEVGRRLEAVGTFGFGLSLNLRV